MIAAIRALVRYRALVQSLVSRELKARYRGTRLGRFAGAVTAGNRPQ